jgi:uncharacterized protein YoxC
MFGMMEFVIVPLAIVVALAPIAIAVWILVTLNTMARNLAETTRAVRYLADRAARQDGIQP